MTRILDRDNSQRKLYTIAYGQDKFAGDSPFWVSSNDAIELPNDIALASLTHQYLLQEWRKTKDEGDEHPDGFWIVDGSHLKVIDAVWTAVAGSDSTSYVLNAAAKRVTYELALAEVTE